MSKRKTNSILELIIAFIVIGSFIGYNEAIRLMKDVFIQINLVLVSLFDTSLLSVVFKYFITFPLVGIILSLIGSPRGKEGHYIGKVFYFIIGYFVGLLLDFLSKVIF